MKRSTPEFRSAIQAPPPRRLAVQRAPAPRTEHALKTPPSLATEPSGRAALTTLLDASPLAIAVLDLEGIVRELERRGGGDVRLDGRRHGRAAVSAVAAASGRELPCALRPGARRRIGADRGVPAGSRRTGRLLDVRASAGVVRDAHGQVTGLLAIAEDVTDRKSVEAERDHWFHESQQLLTVCAADGTIRRVNDAWRRLLRHAPEDLVGRQLIDLVHPGRSAGHRSPSPEPRPRRHDLLREPMRRRSTASTGGSCGAARPSRTTVSTRSGRTSPIARRSSRNCGTRMPKPSGCSRRSPRS